MAPDHPATEKSWIPTPLLWAFFLGSSWTWVIGMFLPVLLVRDHGLWGWVVFAVPNVVGAAAMGWVLRDAGASERFVRRHAGACYAFSLVTVAFHLFFAMWMIERLRGWGLLAVGICVVVTLVPARNESRWVGAIAAYGISLGVWWMLYRQGMLEMPTAAPLAHPAGNGLPGALWLLPAFVMGFGLCPYLDLTFHRARRSTSPAGGRFAFGFGFGVVFFSMIVFTLLYARWLAPAVQGHELGELTTKLLCFHFIAQSAFTVAAHARELSVRRSFPHPPTAQVAAVCAAFIVCSAPVLGWVASKPRLVLGHDYGEAVYWCFLGFYGFVFPGYLWLHGFPGRAEGAVVTRRSLLVLLFAVAVAFPMYWMGFVEGRAVWLVPGIVVVLAARAFVTRRHPDAAPERSAAE